MVTERVDPTARFTGRVDAYVKARPSYPTDVLAYLAERCELDVTKVVAELGSGTGIFTKLLLESGATIYAVEPNDEMRRSAEEDLSRWPSFRSIAGRAEATTLPDASVDLVVAAQAYHWFDRARAHAEMARIVRSPASWVALVWNDRDLDGTPFLRAYEELLVKGCPTYPALQGKANATDAFDELFGAGGWTRHVVANAQTLDREALVLRFHSSSYAPKEGDPSRAALTRELEAIFDRTAEDGVVTMSYSTAIILGHVHAANGR